MLIKKVVTFFDKLEDRVRARLSHWPILYSVIGAVGIILLWKGVWDLADQVPALWGWGSVVLGIVILLMTGLMVSFFIGDSVILSGLRRDKKFAEKSDKEILAAEKSGREEVLAKLEHLEEDMHELLGPKEEKSASQQTLVP